MILWRVFFFTLITIHVAQSASAQGKISVRNDFDEPLYLWVWSNARENGDRKDGWICHPYLPPKLERDVSLRAEGPYFLVARNKGGADDVLGWADLEKVLSLDPDAVYSISGEYVTAQVQYDYTVCVAKAEARTKTVAVCEQIQEKTPNGIRTRTVCRDVQYTYTVMVPSYQTRTATKSVRVPKLEGSILSNGRRYTVDDFLRSYEGRTDD